MIDSRAAVTTVGFIDEYCQHYQKLFDDVRNFEAKFLHLESIRIPCKTLPAIARTVGFKDTITASFLSCHTHTHSFGNLCVFIAFITEQQDLRAFVDSHRNFTFASDVVYAMLFSGVIAIRQ